MKHENRKTSHEFTYDSQHLPRATHSVAVRLSRSSSWTDVASVHGVNNMPKQPDLTAVCLVTILRDLPLL